MAGTIMNDALGTALVVGQTVKITGTIVSLDPWDNTYQGVLITLLHPVAGVPDVNLPAGGQAVAGGAVKTLAVHPSMLVVGS